MEEEKDKEREEKERNEKEKEKENEGKEKKKQGEEGKGIAFGSIVGGEIRIKERNSKYPKCWCTIFSACVLKKIQRRLR